MTDLPGNPHARAIEQLDAEVGDRKFSPNVAHALMQSKLVSATLSLAYEQRTATLVHALLSDSLVTDGKYDDIQAEVRERLGLGDK
ncbi:hypothetical protein CQ010_01275 [Arthrobacter sp. MYb211]|uniref:hypothetical protein n=1 Tax=unclassified Arthrobacter TaxID=235627 RepID=UPI000CFC91B1|nr:MULTISPECIES: hypothetical protein [unclassified Arthrobacter]PRA13305.1 hypothetical protein CQ015_03530 [Arthrobacter sp. MYb221]PRC10502.1 hypothetical protein CQ010_01275 [Arthrobacter sp. MYb211]